MPGITEFLGDLSKLVIQWLSNEVQTLVSAAISDGIETGLNKISRKFLSIGISLALISTGFFLTLWGIATNIDTIFAMRGLGYVLIGILAALTGALIIKK